MIIVQDMINFHKKYLINNIKFFTFEEGNDTISLNKSFLENPGRIKESFDYFSESNFLMGAGTFSPSNNLNLIKVYSCGPSPSPHDLS